MDQHSLQGESNWSCPWPFFCGMKMGTALGLDADYISTHANVVADDISRLKRSSDGQYDHSKLLTDHPLLCSCHTFQPSKAELIDEAKLHGADTEKCGWDEMNEPNCNSTEPENPSMGATAGDEFSPPSSRKLVDMQWSHWGCWTIRDWVRLMQIVHYIGYILLPFCLIFKGNHHVSIYD